MASKFIASTLFVGFLIGCAQPAARPCSEGGEPALEKSTRGSKQCEQLKDASGQWHNHGIYREWYLNGRLAIEGEYKQGKKQGKWTQWDDKGKLLFEKFYEDGQVK